ncbi:MAG: hypothetical protein ISS26_02820 [Candidatus Omnitrophica bacterium]|nr:hypothetical protein [Candidatus Omnitrophota bacterium]
MEHGAVAGPAAQDVVIFTLDFIQERIDFDPTSSIRAAKDDGSVLMAEYSLEINRFLKRYWGNGILELWDGKDGKCLGYSDAFIPVNIDLRGTIDNFNQRIKTCEEEIIKRRDSAKG